MPFLLQVVNIKKQYGIRTVLDGVSLQVYEGDKIGVVGSNGAGKSTLLGILSGDLPPDEGSVTRRCEVALIRQFDEKDETLSGGENIKKRIQQETGKSDTVILADEPTANLDGDGVRWVRDKLLAATTVLLVSHDRDLLDAVCNRVVEVREGKLYSYTGNYTEYERKVRQEQERHQQEYEQYLRTKIGLESAIRSREQNVAGQRARKKRDYATNGSEARLGGHVRKAKMKKVERNAKILEHRLERLPKVEKLREAPKIRMDFSLTDPPRNKLVLSCEELDYAYGRKTVFSGAAFTVSAGEKVALSGKNGSGKTTLLRLIAEGNPAIRRAPKLKPGYFYQGFENLDPARTVLENVLSTSIQDRASVRSILAGLLFCGDDVFKRVEVLSGGERVRLALAKLLAADVNALLLDEPTNYLDIRSQQAVQSMIGAYPGTVVLVSHDERFVEQTVKLRLEIRDRRIHRVEGGKTEKSAVPNPANRMLLEMRRLQLVGEISAAQPDQKTLLEEEYHQVLDQLRQLLS